MRDALVRKPCYALRITHYACLENFKLRDAGDLKDRRTVLAFPALENLQGHGALNRLYAVAKRRPAFAAKVGQASSLSQVRRDRINIQ